MTLLENQSLFLAFQGNTSTLSCTGALFPEAQPADRTRAPVLMASGKFARSRLNAEDSGQSILIPLLLGLVLCLGLIVIGFKTLEKKN